jgi:hypothetical protein
VPVLVPVLVRAAPCSAMLCCAPLCSWSNTWRALHYKSDGKQLKYVEFDPFGKQTAFAKPYMYALFDLMVDPFGEFCSLCRGRACRLDSCTLSALVSQTIRSASLASNSVLVLAAG